MNNYIFYGILGIGGAVILMMIMKSRKAAAKIPTAPGTATGGSLPPVIPGGGGPNPYANYTGGSGSTPPPPTTPTKYDFDKQLKQGDRGEDVRALQKIINIAENRGIAEDGIFGQQTQDAVFHISNGQLTALSLRLAGQGAETKTGLSQAKKNQIASVLGIGSLSQLFEKTAFLYEYPTQTEPQIWFTV